MEIEEPTKKIKTKRIHKNKMEKVKLTKARRDRKKNRGKDISHK
jgi:hypothetical protein